MSRHLGGHIARVRSRVVVRLAQSHMSRHFSGHMTLLATSVVVIVLAHHLNSWSLKAASEILIVVHAKVLWTKILLLRQIHEILIIKHRGERERPDEFIENLLLLGLPIVRL